MKFSRGASCLKLLLVAAVITVTGCSKRSAHPVVATIAEDQATIAAFKKLVEESKARQAAAASSTSSSAAIQAVPVDPYQVERWLSNLGYQRNLAARFHQDINLLATLIPEMAYFEKGNKYDKAFLASGLSNKAMVDEASRSMISSSDTAELRRTNLVIIADPFRTFIINFSTSFYETPRFLAFLSQPIDASEWRLNAISKLNQLISFDKTQYDILNSIAPVLLKRFPTKSGDDRKVIVQKLSASLSLYRTAWALREMSDDDLYRLVVAASSKDVVAAFRQTAEAIHAASFALADDMNASLPSTLSSKPSSPLAALK